MIFLEIFLAYQALEDIKKGSSAAQAVTSAVTVLEDSQITNAGIGSNLTIDGSVECDASVMDGESLLFGAVGCVSEIRNPVQAAYKLLQVQQEGNMSLGRLPPSILVANGAKEWTKQKGTAPVEPADLITESSLKSYQSYKRKLDKHEERMKEKRQKILKSNKLEEDCKVNEDSESENNLGNILHCSGDHDIITDTVGAVAMDCHGNLAAAVSSGGISLKQSGRLGPAATYGAGCWAYNWRSDDKPGVSIATSGSGEHIMRTLLAKESAACLQRSDNASLGLSQAFKDHFLESEYLVNITDKLAGVLALRQEKDKEEANVELIWGHTTDSMCVSYMSLTDKKPKVIISRLPAGCITGQSFTMEGHHKQIKMSEYNS